MDLQRRGLVLPAPLKNIVDTHTDTPPLIYGKEKFTEDLAVDRVHQVVVAEPETVLFTSLSRFFIQQE